jgi:glycosyltransferase involved in cell wall biosynthesis
MKVLYSVQRYGADIVGGSEAACRQFAEHLVGRGHHVEVVTSCARRYTDWANEYPPGSSDSNGVVVHRLPVVAERTEERFGPLNHWTIHGPRPIPLFQQRRWAELMGPQLRSYDDWLLANVDRFDVVVFMTYLYGTTTAGLPLVAGRVPTVLQPTAHDEPALWVGIHDTLFRLADGFLFLTPEERSLVARRFGFEPSGTITGLGIDRREPVDTAAFRRAYGLSDAPYLIYVGRIDRAKGAVQAFEYFRAFKTRNPGPLRFVIAGDGVDELPAHADVVRTGILSEHEKRSGIAGSVALVQPSYFESFSIVLCEAWREGRPAIVQAACDVLRGQAHRSAGAIPYSGFGEFEAAVERLAADPALGDRLGAMGERYVRANYGWDRVIVAVEQELETVVRRRQDRRAR